MLLWKLLHCIEGLVCQSFVAYLFNGLAGEYSWLYRGLQNIVPYVQYKLSNNKAPNTPSPTPPKKPFVVKNIN